MPTGRGCQDAWLWAIFCPRLGTQSLPITPSRLELPSAVALCVSALLAATALSLVVGLLLGAAPEHKTGLLPARLPAVKLLDCTEDLNLCRKHWLKLPCDACCWRCRAPGKLLTGFLCMAFCRDAGVADVLHAWLCVAGCPVCKGNYLWMLQRPIAVQLALAMFSLPKVCRKRSIYASVRDQAGGTARHERN